MKIQRIMDELTLYPFNEQAAAAYGPIRAELERQGPSISERDLQIASIAVASDLCPVTHSKKAFFRIQQLKVEDWAE